MKTIEHSDPARTLASDPEKKSLKREKKKHTKDRNKFRNILRTGEIFVTQTSAFLAKSSVNKGEQEEIAKEEMLFTLKEGQIERSAEIAKYFLDPEYVEAVVNEEIKERVNNSNIERATKIAKLFNVPFDSETAHPEAASIAATRRQAHKEALKVQHKELIHDSINKILNSGKFEFALAVAQENGIPSEVVNALVNQKIEVLLSNGNMDRAKDCIKVFKIPPEIVRTLVINEMNRRLDRGSIEFAFDLAKVFHLPKTLVDSIMMPD